MNPKDKQNVTLATEFNLTFTMAVLNADISSINFRVSNITSPLKELCHVINGVLAIYCFCDYSIDDQLKTVSKAMHVLLMLYRKYHKVVPNVLYHDLQMTFQNIFYSAAKYKIYHPQSPLFLMLLGSDVLERLFGIMRQRCKSGFDHFDLISSTRSVKLC